MYTECKFVVDPSQAAAETTAQTARDALASSNAEAAQLALHHQQQVQQLQQELDLAKYNLQHAKQQSEATARKQQHRTQATSQQIARLEEELAEVVREAEQHNQHRVQAEDKAAALQLKVDSAPAEASDDSILLQNLRDELAAQSADIATARRLKEKIRYTKQLHSLLSSCARVLVRKQLANPLYTYMACTDIQYHTRGTGCTPCTGAVAGSH